MKKATENQPIFLSARGRASLWGWAAFLLGVISVGLITAAAARLADAPESGPVVVRQAALSRREETTDIEETAEAEDAAETADPALLRINDATREELEGLPGVGPVLAGRIVAWREENGPFRDREDLLAVSGIGEGIYERIRPYITF